VFEYQLQTSKKLNKCVKIVGVGEVFKKDNKAVSYRTPG
jgi:hypothetical protein